MSTHTIKLNPDEETLENKYLFKGKRPTARDGHSANLIQTQDGN